MTRKFLRVIIYTRVSTREQAESGYSIGEQEARLRSYCKAMDWTVLKVCADPGFSGAYLNRPGLNELLDDVSHKRCDAVLVWKLDRLSRSQKDTLYLIEDEFLKHNVAFVSMNENFDTSTAFGRAMIGILSVFAQLEREQIRDRMAMGKDARAKSGKFHGGSTPPIGYDYENGELVVNDYEAAQVREIFDLFVNQLWSASRIGTYMREHYTNNHSNWKRLAQIHRTLQHRVYIGEIEWRGHVYAGDHAPLIDRATFDKAQAIIEQRSASIGENRDMTPFKSYALLGGLVTCGLCRHTYFRKQRTLKSGATSAVYMCSHRQKSMILQRNPLSTEEPCQNRKVCADELESLVLAEIRKLSFDPDAFERLASGEDDPGAKAAAAKRKAIEARLTDLRGQVSRLIDLCRLGGGLPIEEIAGRIETLQSEIVKSEKELDYMAASEAAGAASRDLDDIRDKLSSAAGVIDSGDAEAQRELIRSLISKIVIEPEDVEIHWSFAPGE